MSVHPTQGSRVAKAALLSACIAAAGLGCKSNDRASTTEITSGQAAPSRSGDIVDNTAMNKRDMSGTPTPFDQSNDPADIQLTQEIRKAVVADDTLSMTAKNVKIISSGGRVVLRGPVQTQREKDAIAAKAQELAGTGKVDDALEVKNP